MMFSQIDINVGTITYNSCVKHITFDLKLIVVFTGTPSPVPQVLVHCRRDDSSAYGVVACACPLRRTELCSDVPSQPEPSGALLQRCPESWWAFHDLTNSISFICGMYNLQLRIGVERLQNEHNFTVLGMQFDLYFKHCVALIKVTISLIVT